MKQYYESDINVGLIEIRTKEGFERLGRLVYERLMRESSEVEFGKEPYKFKLRQVVVHGS